MGRVLTAIISTLICGATASFIEPLVFAISIPVALMGGFILLEIQRKNEKQKAL
ncbi:MULTISPECIES: hypothetical protein [unclassified Sporosarcina]|uniref:hypothetical protein n=1 Tax=unclassified Sporosarcina TaxID=2647733 RepID=UPI0013047078|nr:MULTISPECIES: hypothetical protein [unclassified Sporosarcina]